MAAILSRPQCVKGQVCGSQTALLYLPPRIPTPSHMFVRITGKQTQMRFKWVYCENQQEVKRYQNILSWQSVRGINFRLTVNMLNCLKDYQRYIHISNHILDLAWPKQMKLTLEQQYMLSVLHSQYHVCWCSGNFRSQCISRNGIEPQSHNIPSLVSEELRQLGYDRICRIIMIVYTCTGHTIGIQRYKSQPITIWTGPIRISIRE